MKNIGAPIIVLFLSLLIIFATGCGITSCNIRDGSVERSGGRLELPRRSFVKIETSIKFKICNPENPEECIKQGVSSSASGFIVKNESGGSFVVTAAHVCDVSDIVGSLQTRFNSVISVVSMAINVDGNKHKLDILNFDKKSDLCMTWAHNLRDRSVQVAWNPPRPGDAIYNLAAPIGIFDIDMIPIMNGHYNGISQGYAMYSVPAAPGSSGSPLFNSRGDIVGMIHSVYIRFPFITLSPTYTEMREFVNKYASRTCEGCGRELEPKETTDEGTPSGN
tara:strand:- start:272 stop:1105 length:834 start_codon:yes stop_codon:yes gene_type:complete